jgi:hypothetical protein
MTLRRFTGKETLVPILELTPLEVSFYHYLRALINKGRELSAHKIVSIHHNMVKSDRLSEPQEAK